MHNSYAPPDFDFKKKFAVSALFLAKISALKMEISHFIVPKTPNFSRKSTP